MTSQAVTSPEYASVLGQDLITGQVGTGYWIRQMAAVSLGTSTAKTKLGGTQVEGTSADYLLDTAARCIVAVRPKIVLTTPTANQAVLATLKVESTDLGMKDYEVFANPIDSGLGTNESMFQDAAPWYPLMQPCNGQEKVQFFGTAQVANTVAPLMSVDVLLSNAWPQGYGDIGAGRTGWAPGYGAVQAKVAGINYGGGPTATATAAATAATDGGVTVSGPKKRLIGLFGVVVGTTPAASKPISGQFSVNASEFTLNPQQFNAEPITGFLGTTTAGALAHISKVVPMNLGWNTPSTPKASFTLDQAITTAGNFEVGYMYLDDNR
ncbi:MAG: hypothetical protein ACREQ5_03625 [Candidatus Dormibacteria bacterium]